MLIKRKQIGLAYTLYTDENSDRFNYQSGWHSALGANPNNSDDLNHSRVLNLYVDTRKLAECPLDAGDSLWNKANAYTAYGTSYIAPWASNAFGIEWTTSDTDPRRVNDFDNPVKKILLGDFIMHPNRDITDSKSHWHSKDGKRKINILFLDMHAKSHTFNSQFESRGYSSTPDPSWGYY